MYTERRGRESGRESEGGKKKGRKEGEREREGGKERYNKWREIDCNTRTESGVRM